MHFSFCYSVNSAVFSNLAQELGQIFDRWLVTQGGCSDLRLCEDCHICVTEKTHFCPTFFESTANFYSILMSYLEHVM